MFIRQKGNCYYLVQSHRVNRRVKQKIVAYLGRCETIEERLYYLSRFGDEPCTEMKPRAPGWKWRRRIAKRLNLTEKVFAEENPVNNDAFAKWYDQKIDAYMKAKCERDIKRKVKRIARIRSQRARLWSLVPQAERAKVEAYIKMRRAQDKRKALKILQEFRRSMESCSA